MSKHDHPWRDCTVIVLASLALPACSPSTLAPADPSMQGNPPPTSAKPAAAQALRVIMKFRQTVPYRDEAFLQDISQKIHARIMFISSIAPDTHVYQIEPQPGQSHADILQRLAGLPYVLRVEADAVARPS